MTCEIFILFSDNLENDAEDAKNILNMVDRPVCAGCSIDDIVQSIIIHLSLRPLRSFPASQKKVSTEDTDSTEGSMYWFSVSPERLLIERL